MIHAYIDGAFLRERGAIAIKRLWDVEPDLDFKEIRRVLDANRVFYYDCIDDAPKEDETQAEFKHRTAAQAGLLAKVSQAMMCHIRLGTLKQQKQGKRITQKEVDVRIAVDMLTHATSKVIQRAVLVTGDLDLRPVVESVVQLGTIVELRFDPLVTAVELQHAADIRQELTFNDWWGCCSANFKKQHRMPIHWWGDPNQHGQLTRQLRIGKIDGDAIWLWATANGTFTVEINRDQQYLCANGTDPDFLINRFLPVWQSGTVKWDAL